jgi:hypothetical protein
LCQSLETVQPDVIIGTEIWLTKDIGNGEIFPAELGFDVIRRDREGDAHGGILIASKSEYELDGHLLVVLKGLLTCGGKLY